VDPNYTFLAKIAKTYLPRADAYGGAHERLREVGRSYRAGR
jgi:amidase